MATFTNYQDELKTCPYNRVHKVAARRYQQHVTQCAKNSTIQLKTCPYNTIHRVPSHQYQKHLLTCPDNRQIIREIVESTSIQNDKKPIRKPFQPSKRADSDDDDECPWSCAGPSNSNKNESYTIPALKAKIDASKIESETQIKYTDPILLQRMSHSERKRHYARQNELIKMKMEEAKFKCKVSTKVDAEDGELDDDDQEPDTKVGIICDVSEEEPKRPYFGGIGRGKSNLCGIGRGRGLGLGVKNEKNPF